MPQFESTRDIIPRLRTVIKTKERDLMGGLCCIVSKSGSQLIKLSSEKPPPLSHIPCPNP